MLVRLTFLKKHPTRIFKNVETSKRRFLVNSFVTSQFL